MNHIRRYGKPVATAIVALALAVVGWVFRPETVKVARPVREDPFGQEPTVQVANSVPWATGMNTALQFTYALGVTLLFAGALALIWSRSRPRGRHRADRRTIAVPAQSKA